MSKAKSTKKLVPFDAARYLDNDEAIRVIRNLVGNLSRLRSL